MNMRDLSGAGGVSAWGLHDASVTQARSGAVRGVCRAALRGRAPATLGRRAHLLGRPRGLLLAREAVARVIVLRRTHALKGQPNRAWRRDANGVGNHALGLSHIRRTAC